MPKPSFVSEIVRGFSIASTISGYIIGPLLLFGFLGYWIDRYFHTGRLALIIALAISFVLTNVLLIKNSKKIGNKLSQKLNQSPEHHGN